MDAYERLSCPADAGDPSSGDVVLDCLNMLAASLDLNTATDSFLEALGCYYDARRVLLLDLQAEQAAVSPVGVWPDGADLPPLFPAEQFLPWLERFDAGGAFCLSAGEPELDLGAELCPGADALMAAPLYGGGQISGFLCVADPGAHFEDLTVLLAVASLTQVERRKLRLTEEVEYLRHKDPLTDVYNRSSYADSLAEIWRSPGPLGILLVSVNGLKSVNAALGNVFGDAVVQRTAELLKETLPAPIYRVNGDVFLSMLPDISREQLQTLTGELRAAFADESGFSVAIGSAWSGGETPPDALSALAEQDLAAHKGGGAIPTGEGEGF